VSTSLSLSLSLSLSAIKVPFYSAFTIKRFVFFVSQLLVSLCVIERWFLQSVETSTFVLPYIVEQIRQAWCNQLCML